MIITRTPFRVSFAGGGSDIPAFYEKHGGCVLSTSINKYMYISVHPSFDAEKTTLKYSETEIVGDISEIRHRYFRSILERMKLRGIEISSTADVPAGTGLGSSSSFTVGVLQALYAYKGKYVSKERLAREACEIELTCLHNPIGKQDQYAAAYGGLNFYEFRRDGSVSVEPIIMPNEAKETLERRLMMFYTGRLHSANTILQKQRENITEGAREENQGRMCALARSLQEQLQCGNIDATGQTLHEGWLLKRTLADGITDPVIDRYYELAMAHGAVGGKLLGAGGGGFLLFYVPENRQEEVKRTLGLEQLHIGFDRQGASVIYIGDKTEF